jgi:phospholipid/cholesterol/gamma-HCH transport system substrate-binding protein
MEFNARYLLNGAFAVAIVLGMFGFVYWLKNTGGFGERTVYQVRFSVPVSGLTNGSDVLFNGVKVGQVDGIYLDPVHPEQLVAAISIAKGTPLRADTVAGVDYAGLTGAASVLLTGGSAEARPLAADGSAVLVADPANSRSWTQKASRILGRLDDILERNDGRFDSILSGLERLAGGGSDKGEAVTHDLPAAAGFPPLAKLPEWQLAVGEPSVVLALNTDRVLEQIDNGGSRPFGAARWADSLPNLFQARVIQSFENAGYTNVLRPADSAGSGYNLVIDIRGFWLTGKEQPHAAIDLMARIIDSNGAVVAVRHFQDRNPAPAVNEETAIAALRDVFQKTAAELVQWTSESIR